MLKLAQHQTFIASGTMDNTAGLTLIPQHQNAGFLPVVETFTVTVSGAVDWNEAASVAIKDTAGNIFATILKSALVGNAVLGPHSAGVTLGAAWSAGGASASGLLIAPATAESTGSPLTVRVSGFLAQP